MAKRFEELVELLRGHRVFIQTHNFPDQDAIASAFGLQELLRHFDIETTICHHGAVERAVTANMVAEFGIEMLTDEIDDVENGDGMTEDDYIIIVDSQKGSGNIDDLIGDEVACIDHHPTFVEVEDYKYMLTPLDEKLIEKAMKYVSDNIDSPKLSVEDLSDFIGMSRVQLYKKIKQITGKTPIEFIRVIRLKRAAQLLRESQLNVSEVAYKTGFNSPKIFSKYFKEEFGILPSAYQDKEGSETKVEIDN